MAQPIRRGAYREVAELEPAQLQQVVERWGRVGLVMRCALLAYEGTHEGSEKSLCSYRQDAGSSLKSIHAERVRALVSTTRKRKGL